MPPKKHSKRIERPAVQIEAVRMLETNPELYFEHRRKNLPFGFAPTGVSAATGPAADASD